MTNGRRRRRPGGEPPRRKPRAEEFSPSAIKRAVVKDVIQNPVTVAPWALSGILAAYTVMIAVSPPVVLAGIVSGFGGLAAFLGQIIWKGDRLAQEYAAHLIEERAAYERYELEDLEAECSDENFSDGEKEARELAEAYQQLRTMLESRIQEGAGATAQRFLILAEDTFKQGVRILKTALRLHKASSVIDVSRLETEIDEWSNPRQRPRNGVDSQAKVTRMIEANQKQLDAYRRTVDEIADLLAQVNELEAALETSFLECAALEGGSDDAVIFGDTGAGTRLEQAVAAARRVEERLRGADSASHDDEQYLKAAQEGSGKV